MLKKKWKTSEKSSCACPAFVQPSEANVRGHLNRGPLRLMICVEGVDLVNESESVRFLRLRESK